MGFLMMLENLSPSERAVHPLHDIFNIEAISISLMMD